MTAVFRREADYNCALLGYYAVSSGNFLSTLRDNLYDPSSRVKMMVLIVCTETSIINYHYCLRNNPEERSSHLLQPCSPCSSVFVRCIIVLNSTGLFISPSGISELDCATNKTDTAERSISIGRESFQVFLY